MLGSRGRPPDASGRASQSARVNASRARALALHSPRANAPARTLSKAPARELVHAMPTPANTRAPAHNHVDCASGRREGMANGQTRQRGGHGQWADRPPPLPRPSPAPLTLPTDTSRARAPTCACPLARTGTGSHPALSLAADGAGAQPCGHTAAPAQAHRVRDRTACVTAPPRTLRSDAICVITPPRSTLVSDSSKVRTALSAPCQGVDSDGDPPAPSVPSATSP